MSPTQDKQFFVRFVVRFGLAVVTAACLALAALSYQPPATPMTVDEARQWLRTGVKSGQSRSEVESWLAANGIESYTPQNEKAVMYYLAERAGEDAVKGVWMAGYGHHTVAELAGLKNEAVHSIVRVNYPETRRSVLGFSSISAYIFFDEHERVVGHYVHESHTSL